jgi:hypothetical protein
MRLDLGTGNFGIGNANPQERLHVAGNGTFTGTLKCQGTMSSSSYQGGAVIVPGNITSTGGTISGLATLTTGSAVSGGNGECRFFIKADSNNAGGEDQNPRIVFTQDGNYYEGSIGLGNNFLELRSAAGGTNGIRFYTQDGSADTNGEETGLNNATLRMAIGGGGAVSMYSTCSISGALQAAPNSNTTHTLGRTAIGYGGGYSDYAYFSHVDRTSAGNYALLQASNGTTFLNASTSRSINLRINNSTIATFASGGFDLDSGNIAARKNTDTTHYFGRAFVGNAGITDAACFGHLDYQNATDCAFRQEANGDTYIGADNGNRVYITEGGAEVASFYRLNQLFGVSNSYMTLDDIVASAYAATLRITATTGRGIVCVGTSLLKNKRDIEDTNPDFIKNVIDNLRPRFYRYTDNLVPEPAKKEWSQIGLIGEEVVEADRRLGTFDEDGETLNGVDYEKLSVYLLAHIKQNLEPKIADLESKIETITKRLDGEV